MGQSVYTKLGNHLQKHPNHLNSQALLRFAAAGLASFVLAFIAASVLAPVKTSDAITCTSGSTGVDSEICNSTSSNFSVSIEETVYSISVTSSHGSSDTPVSMSYTEDSGNKLGDVVVASDTVITTTNSPLDHYLYISTTHDSTTTYANNLINDNTDLTNPKTFIAPGGGDDLVSATTLSNDTWGFALPSTTSGIPANSFDSSYSSVSNDSKFAKVPTLDNDLLIQKEVGEIDEDTGLNTSIADVYYGTKATSNLFAGTYSNTIKYTVFTEVPPDIEIAEYMQDFTGEMCESLDVDKTITLKDRRDEKEYTVIHAQDGNCWMTQNLALINQKIYAEDSDFPSGSFTVPASSTWNSNITNAARVHQATTSGYTDQVYYNWYSATAGSTLSTDGASSYTSICPRGWTLPVNGDASTNKSWTSLMNAYGIDTGPKLLAETTLGFDRYYGIWYYNNSSEYVQGNDGYFWTNSPSSSDISYALYYGKAGFNLSSLERKGLGESIRCVFNADTTMQDFSAKMCNDMTTNTSVTLQDRRNVASYRVVKAADGNCWMADNLMLGSATEETIIKAEDSNFTSGTFTLPASSAWNSRITDEAKLHVATNSGYEGEHYYNWFAATAGSTESTAGVTVNTSICPKGWRLPISSDSNTDKSYAKLFSDSSISNASALIANIPLGFNRYYGNWSYYYNKEDNQNDVGMFQSSSSAYELFYYSADNSIRPNHNNDKANGLVVRCVFEGETIQDITYMQDMTKAICDATNTGVTARLRDKRGRGNAGSAEDDSYGVIKAKDGNCWMTENFDLYNMTGDNAIKAEDSDFTSGTYEIPASSNWSGNTYTEPLVHQATNSGYEDQVYYSWTTAMALNNGSTTSVQDQSICPAGWQVPLNGNNSTNKTWSKLMNAYGATTGANLVNPNHASYPLGFRYFGSYSYAHGEYLQGSYGYFWSSAPENASYAYRPIYIDSAITTQNSSSGKDNGFSMRCVSRD